MSMDITKDPIPELIRKLAIPASVGFFFSTMYNVVDTWCAKMISTDAQAALALSFPIFFIIIAMGTGISQGSTALISNALGAKDHDKAQLYSLQAISFGVLFSVFLTAFGLWSTPWMFGYLGAEGDYLRMSLDYMNVILLGTVFFLVQSILNAALSAQGDTKSFRNLLIAGFFLNVILDPWFLFGGFGLPAMGIRGIAWATVIIQVFGCVYLVGKLSKTELWRDFHPSCFVPKTGIFRDIAGQGFPASLNVSTIALGIFVITKFVSHFGKEGVAAYGVATRVEQIALMPVMGLNIAVLTMVGQNNGARLFGRVRETWTMTLKYGCSITAVGGAAIFFGGRWMMEMFSEDPEVVRIGAEYLRIAAITLCAYVLLFQTIYMLQGLKRPMYAIWIGIYRQIVAPCAVFWLLAFKLDWKLDGIWWGVFLVTWSAALVTLWFGRRTLRRVEEEAAGEGGATENTSTGG